MAELIKCHKQDVILFINKKTHTNYWNDLQQQLLSPEWWQVHPHSWYKSAVNDSHIKITTQLAGKTADPDIPHTNVPDWTSKLPEANHINASSQLCHDTYPPGRDWSLLANLINRQSLCPPKAIFRIIGCVVFADLLWVDIVRTTLSCPPIHTPMKTINSHPVLHT